jgi:hypothetical protein
LTATFSSVHHGAILIASLAGDQETIGKRIVVDGDVFLHEGADWSLPAVETSHVEQLIWTDWTDVATDSFWALNWTETQPIDVIDFPTHLVLTQSGKSRMTKWK